MANVILLRATSQDSSDPYEEAFRNAGYQPMSIPVLETTLTNLDNLASVLRESPSTGGYTGVVVTSARACEAWKTVVKRLIDTRPSLDSALGPSRSSLCLLIGFSMIGSTKLSPFSEVVFSPILRGRESHGKSPWCYTRPLW